MSNRDIKLWWKDMDWDSYLCYLVVEHRDDGFCCLGGKKLNKVAGECETCYYTT